MKLAAVQFAPRRLRVSENVRAMAELAPEADVVVYPELATSGYWLEREELERVAHGVEELEGLRRPDALVVVGFSERGPSGFYNSAAVLFPDGRTLVYRKAHLFGAEKDLFLPGGLAGLNFTYKGVEFGLLVCYEWAFPEVARGLALEGAQVVLHPANLVLPYAFSAVRTRALENKVFWVLANRVGREGPLEFTGKSLILDTFGEVLARGPEGRQAVVQAQVDPSEALDKTLGQGNDLFKDRRPELYRLR